jgi:hypothetical protein
MLEVILAVALVLMLVPFMYYHIADMNNTVKDVALANQIVKLRDPVVDFVRVNQSEFSSDDGSAVPFTAEELASIAPLAQSGWVFRNNMVGGSSIEIYLLFSLGTAYRTANIAKYIGSDAALVSDDNIAYSNDWAVSFDDDLTPGDLVFKITHDFSEADNDRYLHRGTIGGAHLNRMERTLNMNFNNLYNVKNISVPNPDGCSEDVCCDGDDCGVAYINSAQALFLNASENTLVVNNATFSRGGLLSGSMDINTLAVYGDIINFDTINTVNFNTNLNDIMVNNVNISTAANDDKSKGEIEISNSLWLNGDVEEVSFSIFETKNLLARSYIDNTGFFTINGDKSEIVISGNAIQSDKSKVGSFTFSGGDLKYGLYCAEGCKKVKAPDFYIPGQVIAEKKLLIGQYDVVYVLSQSQKDDFSAVLNTGGKQ